MQVTLLLGLSIGVVSLLASYAVRISSIWLRVAAIALIAAPGLAVVIVMLVMFYRGDNHELLRAGALAAYWLLPVAAGVRWGVRDRPAVPRKFSRWLLPVLPIAIAGCIVGGNIGLEMRDRADRWRLYQRQLKLEWAYDERRLRACARTLNAAIARIDAVKSADSGDRRLLGTYETYQEGSRFYVPVLDVSDEGSGGPASPPPYVDAQVGAERLSRRIYVKVSPKGEIWGDPWGRATVSMGGPPESAGACTKATESYVRAYNEKMLRIGAASAPLVTHQGW